MPKFSVVVPVYKIEEYLRECVDSILSQDYTDFEVILVDDGSPDNCPRICDEYAMKDSRVKVIHQKNSGVSAARNNGIKAASGEYLWFVDGDDKIVDGAFEIIQKFFELDFDVLSFGDIPQINCSQAEMSDGKRYAFIYNEDEKLRLINCANSGGFLPYSWKKIFKASYIKDNGIIYDSRLSYGEDAIFNFEAFIRAERIVLSENCIYWYRMRDDGASKKIDDIFDIESFKQLELNCGLRDEIFKRYGSKDNIGYYEDKSRFILETLFMYVLIIKIYRSKSRNKYTIFKKVASSEFIQNAYRYFNVNKIKSKSLDWYVLWAVKHRIYIIGHLICKYVLYK